VNVSVKVSSLDAHIDPIDPDGSIRTLKSRLVPIFRKAIETGAFLNLDIEQYALKDLTLRLFKEDRKSVV
jgi:RHH-type proline utilization regulon transcriptional repressor/proline dehydrogenase/delta 1-pyrroline-5-carboxylate dehydrogenase